MNLSGLKKTAWFEAAKKSPVLRRAYVWLRYGVLHPPFFSSRIRLAYVPSVPVDLHYTFGWNRYDRFGRAHNAGIHRFVEACRGKSVVMDIGAHIGLYALPASRVVARGGRIYAFEPSLPNCDALKRHLRYNHCRNVVVCPDVVGDREDQVVFYEHPSEPDAMGALRVIKDESRYRPVPRRQVTLDGFCQRRSLKPDVIKIDVEGAEARVIRGGQRVLREAQPLVFLSLHPSRMAFMGDSLEDLLRCLYDWGYGVRTPEGEVVENCVFGEYVLVPHGRSWP